MTRLNFDQLQSFTQDEPYSEGDGYLDSETGFYDDMYGDYVFDEAEAQTSTCTVDQLTGKIQLTGALHAGRVTSLPAGSEMRSALLMPPTGTLRLIWATPAPACGSHLDPGASTMRTGCACASMEVLTATVFSLDRAGAYKGLCSLGVKGADKHVSLLPGGLDGRYKLHRCEGGRPAYVREKSPPARARLLLNICLEVAAAPTAPKRQEPFVCSRQDLS